jgi:hypothetical protein
MADSYSGISTWTVLNMYMTSLAPTFLFPLSTAQGEYVILLTTDRGRRLEMMSSFCQGCHIPQCILGNGSGSCNLHQYVIVRLYD